MPPVGVIPATRTPADRVTGICSESRFIATSARASGLMSPISATSTVARTAPISTSPRFVAAGMSDGYTCLPETSTTFAPAGTETFGPTATIFPSVNTTVPFAMSGPLTG